MQLPDASKDKTKDGICGDGLIRGDSSLFSDIGRACAFLCTRSPTYTIKQHCLLGTNRMETLKMDMVQEAAAVGGKKK